MTVAELIKKLKCYSPNLQVIVQAHDNSEFECGGKVSSVCDIDLADYPDKSLEDLQHDNRCDKLVVIRQ